MADPLADLARLEGVPSAFAAARDAVDLAARRRGLRALPPAELATRRRLGADASAELTGEADRWRAGCWALAVELDTLAPLLLTSPLQAIARAHALAAAGNVAGSRLGRIRAGGEVAERMQGLAALLTTPTDAPAMLIASVAHAEIATLAPFGAADDVVARTVERGLLVGTGVDPAGAVPVEAGHRQREVAYRRALAGYATGTVTGVRDWLVHCADAVQEAVRIGAGSTS